MVKLTVLLAVTVVGSSAGISLTASGEGIRVWPVDPHVKVFRDLEPPASGGAVSLRAARNECEPAPIAMP